MLCDGDRYVILGFSEPTLWFRLVSHSQNNLISLTSQSGVLRWLVDSAAFRLRDTANSVDEIVTFMSTTVNERKWIAKKTGLKAGSQVVDCRTITLFLGHRV